MSVANAGPDVREVFLDKYQALSLLGQGGMGQVYFGRDLRTNQEVVIKVMHDHLAQIPAIRQSFKSELQLMMQFNHPYSVRLFDGSLEGKRPCLVMEYVDGISLEQHADAHGRFTPDKVGYWLAQLCQVLHAAHASNILHRDLTLNNLMLARVDQPDESIKVMDFGLAQLTTAFFIPLERLSGKSAGLGGGTPDYVSPEQARGEQIDARADLYSVGVGLYRLLCGVLPFQEKTETDEIIQAQLYETAPTFAERGVCDVPPQVEALVRQLLLKVPAERPGSAKELIFRFQDAIRRDLVVEADFEVETVARETPRRFDERNLLDEMEAWMPESVAIMKLRGFAEGMGGDIVDSEPGRIRIRIRDPRRYAGAAREPEPEPKGLFSLFRKPTPPPERFLHLDLYMEKHDSGPRSMVKISVVLPDEGTESRENAAMREGFGKRICRELRAYLMIGR